MHKKSKYLHCSRREAISKKKVECWISVKKLTNTREEKYISEKKRGYYQVSTRKEMYSLHLSDLSILTIM
jgi:hypothetical protein